MHKKRSLVTGGAGFLGSHLCEKLLSKGHEVICVDNFFTGSKENILHLLNNPYFEIIRHDIVMPLFVEVDEIYNLACAASPKHYQRFPVQTTRTSVEGIQNMLGIAKRLDIPIFQSSTSEVYGDPDRHPQTEDYTGNVHPIGIRACYDEGKRCAETLLFDYHRQYKTTIKIARIFNTYGPRMHQNDGRVVSNFIVQALQNQPITIYGDGSQTRSFCYYSDTIGAFIKLMETNNKVTGPINIDNDQEYSVKQIAETIIRLTNSSSKIDYLPLPQDDPVRRKPCIKKANTQLDWKPKVDLETGLTHTIEYFHRLMYK